jgi:hypothetical protein
MKNRSEGIIEVEREIYMRRRLNIICLFLFLNLFSNIVLCKDSLYLIGTITGQSTAEQITYIKGVGDINGDGYDDFMISIGYHSIQLYLGSLNFNLTPSVIFHYPGKEVLNFMGKSAGIGDVNGDGYNDFLLQGSFADWGSNKDKVFLYYGGSNMDTIPKYEFYEPWIEDWFGQMLEGVGDLNKDGYNDFVISSPYNWSNGKGRVYLFWGGDTISFARSITFVDTLAIGKSIDSFFGMGVANIGDINRDGFDDIAISAGYKASELSEKVYIYYGGIIMDTIPDTIFTSNNLEYGFGEIIKNAGDLNKDGIVDFCIGGVSKIFIYNRINEPLVIEGYSLGAGGDINHDGYNDLITGNDWKIKVYLGSDKFDTTNYLIIDDPQHSLGFSANISIVGDINNDRYDEIFAFSPNWPNPDSALGKVFIYSYRNITSVKENKENIPHKFDLYQNYPNPFNPSTVISYQLLVVSHVTLKVYDMLGREVSTLVDGMKEAGYYSASFNGSKFASGVYFTRFVVTPLDGNKPFVQVKKMLLMK